MDSVVIERDVSRAGRTAATLVALDRSDAIVDTIRAHRILGLLPERDLLALLRQSHVTHAFADAVNFHGKGRAHTDGLASQRRDG